MGSSNIDFTYYVDTIPAKGQTVQAASYSEATGGKGANQAVAAAHWGTGVAFIGAVGDDGNGKKLLEALKSKKIDTSHVSIIKGIPSGNATIFVDRTGSNCITVYPGANLYVPCDPDIAFKCGDILVSQLEINTDAVESYFRKARLRGVYTILNPSPVKALPPEIIENSDMIVANETEACEIGGICADGIEEAALCAGKIAGLGPQTVIVTLGRQGVLLAVENKTTHIPGLPVDAIDTQGAGDAFLGTLAAKLSQGSPVIEAAGYANRVAALSTTRKGSTQVSLPSFQEVEKFKR